jgi:hypothetical protein
MWVDSWDLYQGSLGSCMSLWHRIGSQYQTNGIPQRQILLSCEGPWLTMPHCDQILTSSYWCLILSFHLSIIFESTRINQNKPGSTSRPGRTNSHSLPTFCWCIYVQLVQLKLIGSDWMDLLTLRKLNKKMKSACANSANSYSIWMLNNVQKHVCGFQARQPLWIPIPSGLSGIFGLFWCIFCVYFSLISFYKSL